LGGVFLKERQHKTADLHNLILECARKNKPETVDQLVKMFRSKNNASEEEVLSQILELRDMGKLALNEHINSNQSWRAHLFSMKASWFWITIIFECLTVLAVVFVQKDSFPLVYLRYLLGSIYTLFLPGYSLVKAFFPRSKMDYIETFVLSVGTSLALVPAISMLLDRTPLGIQTISFTPILFIFVTIFAIVALIREHEILTDKAQL
jgi:hypothetical protein